MDGGLIGAEKGCGWGLRRGTADGGCGWGRPYTRVRGGWAARAGTEKEGRVNGWLHKEGGTAGMMVCRTYFPLSTEFRRARAARTLVGAACQC